MLAHHPETGDPIRILKSDAQLAQEERTLVWVRPTFQTSHRWSRWSVVVTEPEAVAVAGGVAPTVAIIRDPANLSAWEAAVAPTTLVIAAHADVKASFPEALDVTELFELYPFLGEPVSYGDPLEKIVVSAAHILRFRNIAWAAEYAGPQLTAWLRACKGRVIPVVGGDPAVVPEFWLIQQYFKHPKLARSREIYECLEHNLANPLIDRILLLNESESDMEAIGVHPKITTRILGHRLTYADVLREIQATEVSPNTIFAFANADIWLDESLRIVWSLAWESRRLFLALLRWEADGTIFGPRADSQDTWMLSKGVAATLTVSDEEFGFPFGKPGCDNAIALAMLRQKCLVANPAYSLITHHVHASRIRNYNPRDILYRPMYMYVEPTAIQAYAAVTDMSRYVPKGAVATAWRGAHPKATIERTLNTVRDETALTIRRMIMMREGGGLFETVWTPTGAAGTPLYEFTGDVFVSREGLISDFQSIYVGKDQRQWREGWESSTVSSLTPAYHVPNMVAIPAPASCWTSLADWVLKYLPAALRIRHTVGDDNNMPEFVVPVHEHVAEFIVHSVWKQSHVGTIPYMENAQFYANHVWAIPEVPRITREDVEALRALLPKAPRAKDPHIVFCLDEASANGIVTEGWVEEVRTCHKSLMGRWRSSVLRASDGFVKRRDMLRDATWLVGSHEALKWMWLAPAGVKVFDMMPETAISSEIPHLAGAAEAFYIPSLVRTAPIEHQRQKALVEVGEAIRMFGFAEQITAMPNTTRPTLILPAGASLRGIWEHAGDTFREMMIMWGERGFCRIQTSDETPYCWWGGIGQVLLYDRPTPRWWPAAEILPSYTMALFGNCAPPGPDAHRARQSVWSFWPRSPRALEAVASKGPRGWDERPTASIFLGKVENGVQRRHRCGDDWASAVEVFSMPVDSTGAPYLYTQAQYLDKVAGTRWGLALPGYGPKCNREIEYFALGTVPIVTEGVDMVNYLVPPKEGVHYFRARTPADVKRIVAETPQDVWERMSAAGHRWWRENASAEGLFRLTWGRIEQCKPFLGVGLPPWMPNT